MSRCQLPNLLENHFNFTLGGKLLLEQIDRVRKSLNLMAQIVYLHRRVFELLEFHALLLNFLARVLNLPIARVKHAEIGRDGNRD